MTGGLRDFLVRLAADPDYLSQFSADAARVLDEAGLTPDERAAVLSRDSERLRSALGAGAADHLTQMLNAIKKRGKRKPPTKKRPAVKKRPTPKKKGTKRTKRR
jgi:hypothetical protein